MQEYDTPEEYYDILEKMQDTTTFQKRFGQHQLYQNGPWQQYAFHDTEYTPQDWSEEQWKELIEEAIEIIREDCKSQNKSKVSTLCYDQNEGRLWVEHTPSPNWEFKKGRSKILVIDKKSIRSLHEEFEDDFCDLGDKIPYDEFIDSCKDDNLVDMEYLELKIKTVLGCLPQQDDLTEDWLQDDFTEYFQQDNRPKDSLLICGTDVLYFLCFLLIFMVKILVIVKFG